MREKVLRELLDKKNVSGGALAQELGITRAAVWKHIKALQAEGYAIEAVPGSGYRLSSLPDTITAAAITHHLKTTALGRSLIILPSTESTNTEARKLAATGSLHGTTVIALEQTAGKGRKGRDWASLKSGIAMSVLLRPALPTFEAPRMTIPVALAVAKAIEEVCGISCRIKWPNDVQVEGKKVCGISLQMGADADELNYIVSGIGINVAGELPEELRDTATTLRAHTDKPIERNALIAAVLNNLEALLRTWKDAGFAAIMAQYRTYSATLHQHVLVVDGDTQLSGYVEDFDDSGLLILRTQDGLRKVFSGDITVRSEKI